MIEERFEQLDKKFLVNKSLEVSQPLAYNYSSVKEE